MDFNFSTADRVNSVIQQMLLADKPRAINRARINALFNGDAPYTAEEARENRISNNINFLEGTTIISQARSQFYNGLIKPGTFFSVSLDTGPKHLRGEWGSIITQEMNRIMKSSPKYYHVLENSGANFVLHGPAPVSWIRVEDWCPVAMGVEDLLVPSKTLTDFSNLTQFSVLCDFTIKDLFGFIKNKEEARKLGWNIQMVSKLIEAMSKQQGSGVNNTQWDYDYPEKAVENYKADSGYWGSDAAPTARCYDFYHLVDEDKEMKWCRKIVLSQQGQGFDLSGIASQNEFLFDGKNREYAGSLSEMLHVLVGDGAVKAPFRYHSVRSLGYLQYAICHLQNRIRCKFTDAAFESMLWYFRNVADSDGERLEKIDLHHLGIIPEGLSWIPQNERHQVDYGTLNGMLGMNRQLMAESSSSFVRDNESGSSREMTATEIMARENQSSALMGSMMNRIYTFMPYQYREIARRFSTLDSPDCVKFRKRCMAEGVDPAVFKNMDAWDIKSERVMGGGNKTLELAQAERMMGIRPLLPPAGQQQVLRDFIVATTDDPSRADTLVPLEAKRSSRAQEIATLAWGSLIDGKPVMVNEGINYIEYADTLLELLNMELGLLQQAEEVPDGRRLLGLQNVIQTITQTVQHIAQDPEQGERVKAYSDALANATNMVKELAKQLQAKMESESQQQGGMSPESQAKVMEIQATGEAKRQQKDADAEQKRQQKEIQFLQDQQRKNEQTMAEIQRTNARTEAQINQMLTASRAKSTIDVVDAINQPTKPTTTE